MVVEVDGDSRHLEVLVDDRLGHDNVAELWELGKRLFLTK